MDNTTNCLHVEENSQFYTDLDMIKRNIEMLKFRLERPNSGMYLVNGVYNEPQGAGLFYTTSLEDDINYLIKGLENTLKKFKMVEL